MRLHPEAKHTKEMLALLAALGVTALVAAAVPLPERSRVHSDPIFATAGRQGSATARNHIQGPDAIQFTVFTSPAGDYSFEAPAAWASPLDPRDPTREAFFVRPVDQTRHTVVFLTVSRYPHRGTTASLESLIGQLQLDPQKHVLSTESLVIDQHPARLVRIHELAAVPMWTPEIVRLDLRECILLIENGSEIYVLEYVASPEMYGEYWPIFDHLVTSFHFRRKGAG